MHSSYYATTASPGRLGSASPGLVMSRSTQTYPSINGALMVPRRSYPRAAYHASFSSVPVLSARGMRSASARADMCSRREEPTPRPFAVGWVARKARYHHWLSWPGRIDASFANSGEMVLRKCWARSGGRAEKPARRKDVLV